MDRPVLRMVFFETCHALRFGSDKTKAKFGMFHWRAGAQFRPMLFDEPPIEPGHFTDRNQDLTDARGLNLPDDSIEKRLRGLLFTHRME